MASLTLSQAIRAHAAFTSQQQRPRSGRRLQRCYAADDDKKLDFSSNKRSALGFTENDSAGQTNIFAVEPKSYVAGSSADTTSSGSQATLLIAGVAAVAAAAAVAGGLLGNSGPTELASLAPSADVKTLSAYAAEFSVEFSPAAVAAPAPAADSE
ncbi:hypothetical protein ABPG75_010770 [Micractinium tetrahymenae]